MHQVRPCFAGENRKHWAMTLYYQSNISWPALDGLMIDCHSFMFRNGQTPNDMTASAGQKERDIHCLSAGWPWLSGPQVVARGSKVNWFGEGRLQGLDWAAEDTVSVLCKVQSCVTHWHTHVCLEYHGFLCGVLNKPAVCGKKKKTTSACLVLCSQPELDAASPEVPCFLYPLILFDFCLILVFCLFWGGGIFVTRTYMTAFIQTQDTDSRALYLVSTRLRDKCTWYSGLLLCIRTARLRVMCLLLWKGRRLAVCLLPSSWNLSVPLGSWVQVYRTAEAALTAPLISFGARHAALPLAAWTGFVPFLPLYIHKLYI